MILLDMQNFIYGVLMVKGKSYCGAKWIKWAFSFAFKTIINQDSIDAERSHPSSSLELVIDAALSQDCFTLLCKQLGWERAVPRDQLVWSQEMHQIQGKRQQPDQDYFPLIKKIDFILENKIKIFSLTTVGAQHSSFGLPWREKFRDSNIGFWDNFRGCRY